MFEAPVATKGTREKARISHTYCRMVTLPFTALLLLICLQPAVAAVRITEISDKGSAGVCAGEDWVELFNPSSSPVNLTGFTLHDDKGPDDSDAFHFLSASSVTVINPTSYLLLCTRSDTHPASISPQFKIGGTDTITLLDTAGNVVASSGVLAGLGKVNLTWAYTESGSFQYTTTPTPGHANVISADWASVRDRLTQQDVIGEDFFSDAVTGAIVNLHLTMDVGAWEYQQKHVSYEVYRDFTGLKVTNAAGAILANLNGPGMRMRPRGQSTMAISACLAIQAVPFLIDVGSAQPLFGMEKFYLRSNIFDGSFMREWSMHRMLRRFGLPYLRTRTAKFHVNGDYVGTYNLMEAPDQDYVFYRAFGNKTPASSADPPLSPDHALYKMKTLSKGCGLYDTNTVASASLPEYTAPTDTDHYAFKRGIHRELVPVLGEGVMDGSPVFFECMGKFGDMMARETRDVVAAWLAHDKDCGKMLVEEGLVDRDLGSGTTNDANMKSFINTFLANDAAHGCRTAGCSDSTMLKCRSADGKGGYDCWAGNGDPFACSDEYVSKKTGKTVMAYGSTYEEYRCCSSFKEVEGGGCVSSSLADFIDVDDFLKNFAVYAVTLNQDSPLGNLNNWFVATTPDLNNSRKYKILQYDHNNVGDGGTLGLLCDQSCAQKAVYWSVARPTCGALADHPLAGPILAGSNNTAAANMAKYLAYVRDFTERVYTDKDFLVEMEAHANAIKDAVKTDVFGKSIDFSKEMTAGAGRWQDFNLLSVMKARGDEVMKQLDALEAGDFPRLGDQVPVHEKCQDWRQPTNTDFGSRATSGATLRLSFTATVTVVCVILQLAGPLSEP